VLVVDRETVTTRLGVDLAGQRLQLSATGDPATALLMVGRTRPNIVVLGPVVGRLDAIGLLEVLRAHEPQLPVIVGVGVGDGRFAARVAALGPAAVVAHPYRLEQLLRLLQSCAPSGLALALAVAPLPIDLGRLRIDAVAPVIEVDGVRGTLPPRQYLLLRFLAERVGQVVSRVEIEEALWGVADDRAASSLAVHIMRLRRRLTAEDTAGDAAGARDHGGRWITAVRGLGYMLTIPGGDRRTAARTAE
jgi:DNA-binding response OmpR family regulator